MKAESKYKGSIKLSAIGDALGWITEFEKNSQSLREKYGVEKIEEFHSWKKNVGGRFNGYTDTIEAGSYSDDTQMLLAVARSIKKNGDIDHNYFAKVELANWLYYARGGGRTIKVAANKIQRKSAKWYSNYFNYKVNEEIVDYRQCGANGAAMRILPIALANLGNIEKIKEEIFCNSIITHGHPRAILGAMLYAYAINQIIVYQPEYFSWENYIIQIGSDFSKKFELSFINRDEINSWLNDWDKSGEDFTKIYANTLAEAQELLRSIYISIKKDQSIKEALTNIGCYNPKTKGSGIATVIAGIYFATKFHNKPLQAIIEAVNSLGTDTDSIAAFAGGLIGALHGQSIIPQKWKSVQDEFYLDVISEKLLAISEDRYDDESITFSSDGLRLINNLNEDNISLKEAIEFFPLGKGVIFSIDRQRTLTKGKYNLLLNINLDCGQSVLITKLFDDNKINFEQFDYNLKLHVLLDLANKQLKPVAFDIFNNFVNTDRRELSIDYIEMLITILENNK